MKNRITERLKKLHKKYGNTQFKDIELLETLLDALEKIEATDFSRYQKLLKLFNDSDYGWNKTAKDDRIVIFTERIETMKFLSENLRKDLNMNEKRPPIATQMTDDIVVNYLIRVLKHPA